MLQEMKDTKQAENEMKISFYNRLLNVALEHGSATVKHNGNWIEIIPGS